MSETAEATVVEF